MIFFCFQESIPFAVVGSTQLIEVKGKKVRGRLYPWGVVELENDEHCDYLKLRTMLISHMQDLQEVTHDLHYENYRATRLADGSDSDGPGLDKPRAAVPKSDTDIKLREKEAELARMQAMLLQMQQQLKQQNQAPSSSSSHNV
jgi:septin 2